MTARVAIAALAAGLLSGTAAPPDPHPLNDSQRERLSSADDGSANIDEAAFYALLENAAGWTSDATGGAVLADYTALRDAPQSWRGVRCLVEGTLYRVIGGPTARKSWDAVEGLVIRVGHDREPPEAEDFVIVYLDDPPAWKWWIEEQGLPVQHGSRVRVAARFYKIAAFGRQSGDGESLYATFVGHRVAAMTEQPAPGGKIPPVTLLVVGLVLLAGLLWWMRRASARAAARPLSNRHIARHRGGQAADGSDEDDTLLPEDPAEALDTLAGTHEQRDKRRSTGD